MVKLADGRHFDETKYDPRYKYNMYVCRKGHQTLSCDVDLGVTPMFIICRRPGCDATSESQMYPDPAGLEPHHFPVRLVFRLPTKDEKRKARRDNYIDHYDRNGLAMEFLK